MKRTMRNVCGWLFAGALVMVPTMQAQAPDNTAANKGDQSAAQPTADQAKDNTSDRQLMRQIRREVVKDKSLSTYGHNVKIIADHGKVTLKGPVHSDDEKKTIEGYASKIAGDGNVTSELTVKSDQSNN
jgi:hyperosmotically inducible periplasmic protein